MVTGVPSLRKHFRRCGALQAVKHRRLKTKGAVHEYLPGAEFYYNKERYIMTGQLSRGVYLRAAGQGVVNFKSTDCHIVRQNRGLVYLGAG